MKKYLAEMIGTMVLVLMGCGTAVSLGCNPVGADLSTVVGTAMAFGLSVIAMAYTIGGISGCHINPAITLGVFLSKRMSGKDALMYIVFQVIGGLLGAAILYALVTSAGTDFALAGAGLGSNDLQSGVSVAGGLIAEIVFTCVFVLVVLGATASDNESTGKFAGLAIGLSLILVHLVCIRYTGTSVNPARSFGPALFAQLAGGPATALSNLWIFIVGPFAGAVLASCIWKVIGNNK
ncbi:MIP/aquaporin family protein [Hoylesella nanceiensis]|jgi:MIP family channel protein|uniref:MIP/aquaporin family protein n=2 Tax=Hoylesella nanceiensis TaxID=425941 RepID=UPI001C5E7DC1|nr:MIP family channel protein [Hoylesella nanceiensis]MBF1421877.1 MIP family channel protein [Hoylesella nanceiensis]MBF1428318.1 MIP family channel protein [Hoylesella nanceiensis]MBF1432180.1 MIP family channel protein [Hoylesella nanceiensis]MBF1436810.1 MIP family channel protein [Hoylesella nanceiensis]MBF1441846.1 MIP family channel protein [Hoylesella nanceiensis]